MVLFAVVVVMTGYVVVVGSLLGVCVCVGVWVRVGVCVCAGVCNNTKRHDTVHQRTTRLSTAQHPTTQHYTGLQRSRSTPMHDTT